MFALGVVWFVLGCFGFNLIFVGLALGWVALVCLLVYCDLCGGVGWFCFGLAISKAYSILVQMQLQISRGRGGILLPKHAREAH